MSRFPREDGVGHNLLTRGPTVPSLTLRHGHTTFLVRQPLDVGSAVFSHDRERDADDVAMYLLARAGRPIAEVTNLRRHMAQHSPANVKCVGTHPTTKARLVRLERTERDMAQRIARGELPRPQTTTASILDAAGALATYQRSGSGCTSRRRRGIARRC